MIKRKYRIIRQEIGYDFKEFTYVVQIKVSLFKWVTLAIEKHAGEAWSIVDNDIDTLAKQARHHNYREETSSIVHSDTHYAVYPSPLRGLPHD